MSTSDFPAILAGSLHGALRNGYELEPASHREWVRVASVEDFRLQARPILGSAPDLHQVNEGGEYEQGSLTDDLAKYSVTKFGRIVSLTWEALVNDNLSSFIRLNPALGQAARRKESDSIYVLFGLNAGAGPTMQDGIALFDAAHANVAAQLALGTQSLAAGRALLRKQTTIGGGHLSLIPRYWIVPPEFESAAEATIANASRPVSTEKTTAEWIGTLKLVVEPRLAATATYLAAGFDQIDTVELGVLDAAGSVGGFPGGPGPVIETDLGFVRDELKWKVRHTFGAAVLDWRGLVKMPTL